MSKQLMLTLYKDLLKKAKKFDNIPQLKACITPPELKEILGNDRFYVPTQQTFVQMVKDLFRKNRNTPIEQGATLGFAVLKDLNNVENRMRDKLDKIELHQKKNIENPANIWAQATTVIQPGTVLITHPGGDFEKNKVIMSEFYKTVVVLTKHDNKSTVGFILNKLLSFDQAKSRYAEHYELAQRCKNSSIPEKGGEDEPVEGVVVEISPSKSNPKTTKLIEQIPMPSFFNKPLWFLGGPVAGPSEAGLQGAGMDWLCALHRYPHVSGASHVVGDVFCGGNYKQIRDIMTNNNETPKVNMLLGRAVWAPGQLQSELDRGWWMMAQTSPDLIFPQSGDESNSMWEKTLQMMGGEYESFSMVPALLPQLKPTYYWV
jgi:putative AlgH/UPF0301 family transcriptional regulator